MESYRQLEMEKLKQLDNPIKETKQDKEECQRQMEHNKIVDEKDNRYKREVNETV